MKLIEKWILILQASVLLLFFQNCSPLEGIVLEDENAAASVNTEFQAVQKIFSERCLQCHGEANESNLGVDLSTLEAMVNSGVLVPGNAERSSVYLSVADGSMPQGGPALSATEMENIRSWIDRGAPDAQGQLFNQLPVVDAGDDQLLILPTDQTQLSGAASDQDGELVRTLWTQVSGPSTAILDGSRSLNLNVSNLDEGVYEFELMVEDDLGAVVSDRVLIVVQSGLN